jgi:hypothetical protein
VSDLKKKASQRYLVFWDEEEVGKRVSRKDAKGAKHINSKSEIRNKSK